MKKVLSILLIFIIIIFMLSNVVLAGDPTSAMKDFNSGSGNSTLSNVGSNVYGIILIVGSAVAFITLAVMAIKFMTAAPDEKAEIKKNLIGFVVGVLILICTLTILRIFQAIGQSIN